MFAALTLLATSVLKIPTPTMGYIHIGDAFVLLSGICLGPIYGGLAAGIGSALADLLGGYVAWVPGTFLIKFFVAFVAGILFRAFTKKSLTEAGSTNFRTQTIAVILAGVIGELLMVGGYFLYEILLTAFGAGEITQAGLAAAALESATGIPFNIVQGVAGIILSTALLPVFRRIFQRNPELAKG